MPGVRLRLVDAFTNVPFAGNPAAVVVLDSAPPDEWMLAVAREINVSDTAFLIRGTFADADFGLRWFTPAIEVDLCGHATLATAHCLFEDGVESPVRFATRSGILTVSRRDDGAVVMDFPSAPPEEVDRRAVVAEALGVAIKWTGRTEDGFFLVALLSDESAVRRLHPDLAQAAQLDATALVVSAQADPGAAYDFVSRLFAPNAGLSEDPVTGSSHTVLGPLWAERLGRTSLTGFQVSHRPGLVGVEVAGPRVAITGHAAIIFDGALRFLPPN